MTVDNPTHQFYIRGDNVTINGAYYTVDITTNNWSGLIAGITFSRSSSGKSGLTVKNIGITASTGRLSNSTATLVSDG